MAGKASRSPSYQEKTDMFICFILLFYLPYLSSIHEKASCIAILWTGSPHSLGSCLFRGLWATCLPHKGGASRKVPCPRTQQANLPACFPQPPLNAERQAGKLRIPFFKVFWYDSTKDFKKWYPQLPCLAFGI